MVNELKDQREKNTKFMEKVDSKLLQMKKDMQKLLKEENTEDGRTKQTDIIVKDQRQNYGLIAKHFKEIRKRIEKAELSDATYKHNLMGEMKDQNEKIVSVITGLIQKLREEREEDTATETKKKGACFICNDPGHYAPDCPNRKEKKGNQGGSYYPKGNQGGSYYQKGYQKGNQGSTYNNRTHNCSKETEQQLLPLWTSGALGIGMSHQRHPGI